MIHRSMVSPPFRIIIARRGETVKERDERRGEDANQEAV